MSPSHSQSPDDEPTILDPTDLDEEGDHAHLDEMDETGDHPDRHIPNFTAPDNTADDVPPVNLQ